MEAIRTIDELADLRSRLLSSRDPERPTIVIPAGTCGQASGANDLIRVAKRELLARGLAERIDLLVTGCHGYCQMEPSVLIGPARTFYPRVQLKDMARIVAAAADGSVLTDLVYRDPDTGEVIARQEDLPFYRRQVRTILGRGDRVDPIRIYHYLADGGYKALADVLQNRSPRQVVDEVKASGLRGRGGAGFPTGLKWELLAARKSSGGKFLVCNGDEGDPGAYMDRSVLEGSPHSVIEGMLIGAFATGATEGVLYVRGEYPLAIKHLIIALRQARELGLLGPDILGTGLSFDISLVRGAGAFVCGEETALIHSVEGKVGEPRQRPPFPVERGIDGKPTAINNVETWANIPVIFEWGAPRFARVGTPGNAGTKIFSLVGKVKNTGLVEVPMGTTLREIVYEIGGGPVGRGRIKAVQTGGPSGGCIPAAKFDLPIDYESLAAAGSIMGSGGMIVLDDNSCMVDLARYYLGFLKDESCGKCFPCRKGTQRMYELLDDIATGKGSAARLDLLQELAVVVKETTMCGLGQTASNPVLSTLRYFRAEYERHIRDRRCDAFVCRELVGSPCQSACPLGTEAWRYVAHLSRGEYAEAYAALRASNPFPSVCARVCDHPCESRCRLGTTGSPPVAIRALKRFLTDTVDPAASVPAEVPAAAQAARVAVIGAGPAGLTAAHYLALGGYRVTVFEAEDRPGGMLVAGIPEYRLPRATLQKEIAALLGRNVTLQCNSPLGRHFTLDRLFAEGHRAIFLALGAHRSRRLGLAGEEAAGVFPSLSFLKAWNLRGESLAHGRVGVVGGGNAAVDAARVALRQRGVESVTLLYRRKRAEMPAFATEVEAALAEGVQLVELVAPTRIQVRPEGLAGVELVRNSPGPRDASGRPQPVPQPGTEHTLPFDTLIVAIGEQPVPFEAEGAAGLQVAPDGTLVVDPETLATGRSGVFAGGDTVTGPDTVVNAIAAGKRAATMIDRYLRGEELRQPLPLRRPVAYVPPGPAGDDPSARDRRAEPPTASMEERRRGFTEVERTLAADEAVREARRCLRCDLDFTAPRAPAAGRPKAEATGGGKA